MKILAQTAVVVVLFASTAGTTNSIADPKYLYPIIEEHGGIIELPDAAHQPNKNSNVLLFITSDDKSGSVIKGLDREALILNQYTQSGAGPENGFKMAVVLHGPATKAALSHDAYAKHTSSYLRDKGKAKNPNLELMAQLNKAGVEIFVCGQALAHYGSATGEVASQLHVLIGIACGAGSNMLLEASDLDEVGVSTLLPLPVRVIHT